MSEALSSDTLKVDTKHNEMNPGDLKAKTLGRLILPTLITSLAENR